MGDLVAFADRLGLSTSVELSAAGEPLPDYDDEEMRASYSNTACYLGDDSDQGPGTLYITTRRLLWLSSVRPSQRLVLEYPQIVMHAVSRDTEAFPRPCIYLQLDEGSVVMEHDATDHSGSESEEDEAGAELRFVPADLNTLDEIFRTMSDCAALNPDPDMQEEGDADLFFDHEEVMGNLTEEQRAMLDHYDTMLVETPGADELDELIAEDPERFEDAEDEEFDDHPGDHNHSAHDQQQQQQTPLNHAVQRMTLDDGATHMTHGNGVHKEEKH